MKNVDSTAKYMRGNQKMGNHRKSITPVHTGTVDPRTDGTFGVRAVPHDPEAAGIDDGTRRRRVADDRPPLDRDPLIRM
jgi:hypothetical protein